MILKKCSSNRARIVLVLILALAIAGCTRGGIRRSEGPAPKTETLVFGLKQLQSGMNSFAGRGTMKYKDSKNRHSGEVMVAAARPDRVRFQVFGPMGRSILTITTFNGKLNVLDHQVGRFLTGPATPENVGMFLPVGLAAPDIVTILSGSQPLPDYERSTIEATTEMGSPGWRLGFFKPGMVERIYLTEPGPRVDRVEIGTTRQEALLTIDYSDYNEVSGRNLPYQIKFKEKKANSELTINYEEIKVNPDLPDSTFDLIPPPGIKAEPIPQPRA